MNRLEENTELIQALHDAGGVNFNSVLGTLLADISRSLAVIAQALEDNK